MKSIVEVEDNELIEAFRAGNTRAFETLLNRYKDRLFSYVCSLTKDKHIAEDIFQDACIRIIDSLRAGRYKENGKFLAWAIFISRNLYMDHLRKSKRKPTIVTHEGKEVFEWLASSDMRADDMMIRDENTEEVQNLINSLSPEQREVVVLKHYGELTFREIAELTKCSINTALGRMHYSLTNMRKKCLS
ncbi:MAG: sigma-70 family RNA polymerase sigma factor [Filimonas sp.]|nr:sigma-70 family RNA polymerase sigma factor [Filimonas sp.]